MNEQTRKLKLRNWLPYGVAERYFDGVVEIALVKVHARAYRVKGTSYGTDLGETMHATLGMARRRVRGLTDAYPTRAAT